ncbi:hypothetical protein Tco_1118176 [Tanacetum coccineum]
MQESKPPKKIKKRVQVQMSINEELAQKVFDEEQAKFNAEQEARFKAEQEQERIDFETALELQKPFSVAEVRKNMCMYLKSQGGYKMSHFKGMSYEDIRPIFERVWDQNQAFVPKDSEFEKEVMKRPGFDFQKQPAGESLKRAGQDIEEEATKRQKTRKVFRSVEEQTGKEPKTYELSQEQLQQILLIVPEEGMHIEALQTKYPIIYWEIHSEDTMKFWKIIRVGNHSEVYQVFEDTLKNFDREDLVKLWSLVKERFNSPGLTDDKEKELWVELKRLFESDEDDTL